MIQTKLDKEKERLKAQRLLHKNVIDIFMNAGFLHIDSKNKDIKIGENKSEIDGIFIWENLILLCEETVDKDPKDHLRKKVEFFKKCNEDKEELFSFLKQNFKSFKMGAASKYKTNDFILCMVYASQADVTETYRKKYKEAIILDK